MIGKLTHQAIHTQAIVTEDEVWTYGELQQRLTRHQQRLSTFFEGDMRQKKVALLLENGADFLSLFLAVSASGAIAVPLDPKWGPYQFEAVLADLDPDLLLVHSSLEGKLPSSSSLLTVADFLLLQEGCLPEEQGREGDLFYIGYTSGTTGTPKGFMRTHQSWFASFEDCERVFQLDSSDSVCSPGPLVHSHFLFAAVQALHMGATLYVCKKFSPETVHNLVTEHPISVMYIVPTMFEALLQTEAGPIRRLSKILSSGAKWKPESMEKMNRLFPNADLIEFFGASELSFVSYLLPEEQEAKAHTVGRPFPSVEIKIVTKEGVEAATGEVGELFVKSPWVFKGYLHRPEETEAVFHNGWVTIGDLASVDEDGYVHVIGRKHNMIITGGLNVYPEEVEKVYANRDEVMEVAVTGVEDAYWGEKVVALYSASPDHEVDVAALEAYGKTYLPSYKCPKEWIRVEEIPHTNSGKIARKTVKEWASSQQ